MRAGHVRSDANDQAVGTRLGVGVSVGEADRLKKASRGGGVLGRRDGLRRQGWD